MPQGKANLFTKSDAYHPAANSGIAPIEFRAEFPPIEEKSRQGNQEADVRDDLWTMMDRAIAKGGRRLYAKEFARSTKAEKATLGELCRSGSLVKKGAYYFVTTRGFKRWAQVATPEHRAEVEHGWMVDFLALVSAQPNKRLSEPQKDRVHETTRDRAIQSCLVEVDARGRFTLTSSGQIELLASQPRGVLTSGLRTLHHELHTSWSATLRRAERDVDSITGKALEDAIAPTRKRVEEAETQLREAMESLTALKDFQDSAQAMHDAVRAHVRAALSPIEEAQTKLERTEKQVRSLTSELQQSFDEYKEGLERRLDGLSEDESPATGPTVKAESTDEAPAPDPSPPESSSKKEEAASESECERPDLLESTRLAFEALRARNEEGPVSIPDLYDEVTKDLWILQRQYHELLLRWRAEDRLTLRAEDEAGEHPRSHDGIESADGVLVYVDFPR